MTDPIYLDNHATTPMDPLVLEAMLPWLTNRFGNPHSVGHAFGEQARIAVDQSRKTIADCLHAEPHEIVFTSGATESNNLAIRGIADRHGTTPVHFVSVTTEHKAVLDPLQSVAAQGHQVTLLEPDPTPSPTAGLVSATQFSEAILPETQLASVMLVNNEIGIVQPVAEIAQACHERGVLIHCDATQAVGKIAMSISDLDADLLSISGHKIYGPRGVGLLMVRRRRPRIRLDAQIVGGGQEQGRRSGTLNVPGIVGLAKAIELCVGHLASESQRIGSLRDRLFDRISAAVANVKLNGPRDFQMRVPGNLNLHFEGVEGEALMMNMGEVAVSSGSACTSANPEPSHVLRAIGLTEDQTRSSLRFGIGRFNTQDEIDIAAQTVADAVHQLRGLG